MDDRVKIDPGLFEHLIDAEREALARAGRKVDKVDPIKALRGATGLGPRDARRAVDRYLALRGGVIPVGPETDRPAGWIDDLLDAERATASKEERRITKVALIKAIRGATGLGLKPAKEAVEDYLRRRGGEGLPSGANGEIVIAAVAAIAAIIGAAIYALR